MEKSVRQISTELGVTRARVYQLLEDCSKVIDIRWPEGRLLYERLGKQMSDEAAKPYEAARQLFFSDKHELASA